MSSEPPRDVGKDVRISRDGNYRTTDRKTGLDASGYLFKYEAQGITFWINAEQEFPEGGDGFGYDIVVCAVGKVERMMPNRYGFSQSEWAVILQHFVRYFRENGISVRISARERVERISFDDPSLQAYARELEIV